MFEMEVPYDKRKMRISMADENFAGMLVGRQSDYVSEKSEKEIVEESLDHVIGSQNLEELAKGRRTLSLLALITLVLFRLKSLHRSFFAESEVYRRVQESGSWLQLDSTVRAQRKN